MQFKYVLMQIFQMNRYVIAVLTIFLYQISDAQTNTTTEIAKYNFKGTRFVNEHSVHLAEKGELLFLIQHRFGELGGGLYELFGLDRATMRLGFEYGLSNSMNIGFGRSSWLKTYDIFAKYRMLEQTSNFPITIVAVAGTSIPTMRNYFPISEDNLTSKSSAFGQLLTSVNLGSIGIQLSPGYISTGYLPAENRNYSLFTTGLAGSVKLSDMVSVNLEYLHWYNSEFSYKKPLSLGVDLTTRGHLFQLILSNSRQMFSQSLYTATMGSWQSGTVFLGFNLIREFRLHY
jgi:hypothetical protein